MALGGHALGGLDRRRRDHGGPVWRHGMPLAGEGAPLVAEFAVTEFAAAIGLSTDAGKPYVGHALELCHRLPRVWRRVVTGDLRPWLARRIAEQTLLLSPGGSGVCGPARRAVAHKIGPVQLERLVEEAIAPFMPDLAEERRLAKADGRYFTVEQQQVSYAGTAAVHGDWTSPTPWTSTSRRRPRRAAEGPRLRGLPQRPPRGRRR